MDITRSNNNQSTRFPPVVSVLGHVDHGKTTLLDTIRKTKHASREVGGITQKIGATQIEVSHEKKTRKITFVDTPGHEAFSNMRSGGVTSSDLVLLVVAADNGVKSQTEEAIQTIRDSGVPFIVTITKTDSPGANVEKVKQQMVKYGVQLEGLGGDVPYIAVSAKTGEKISDLLDLILLVYDLAQVQKDSSAEFLGVIIDSKLDKRRGLTAVAIIKSGVLRVGDKLYTNKGEVGKIRALFTTVGQSAKEVFPGEAAEILGVTSVLPLGTVLATRPVEMLPTPKTVAATSLLPHSLAEFLGEEKKDTLSVVLKTEAGGELDAIKTSLPSDVHVSSDGQGDISVSDILLAKDFKAIVLGFNVDIDREAKRLAENEHVFFRIYHIIYELLDEVKDALAALQKASLEEVLGRARILASFSSKNATILGVRVLEGKFRVHDHVKVMRGDQEIGRSKIVTLRRGKQEVKEVEKGTECGMSIQVPIDFQPQDMLLSYNVSR